MKNAKWVVSGNHIALSCGGQLLHPDAKEVWALVSGNGTPETEGIVWGSPEEDIPGITFSRIGCPLRIRLESDGKGNLTISLFAVRGGCEMPVDIIDGHIIDHCISGGRWHFLSGNVSDAGKLVEAAGIKSSGKISIRQYIRIIGHKSVNGLDFIDDRADLKGIRLTGDSRDVPQGLKAVLYPYQVTGWQWLRTMAENTGGCILGDEMGLGKTMQVIAELLHLRDEGSIPSLVVAPVSLLENWRRECRKFAPSLMVLVHHGPDRISNFRLFRNYDVVITSYQTVVNDNAMLRMLEWKLVVLDEAQNIKNPESRRTKACKSLVRAGSIAVSGTPFENHVSDIWSLVDFIQPGLLGTIQEFSRNITDDAEGGRKIEPVLSPLMLRRLVADVAQDLPEKVVSSQPLRMSEEECTGYNRYLEEIKSGSDADHPDLGMLQGLRVFCTHPWCQEGIPPYGDPCNASVKYQRCCEIIEEIISRGEKVLVFTSYRTMFGIFRKDIPPRFGIPVGTINGDTPVDERQRIVDRFNRTSGSALLVLNPRAAGTGLNITGANHVIHYNPEWNPALEDQASARAYRRGQERTVFIYRLYYLETVEEVVNDRIDRKRNIAGSAIVGTDGSHTDADDIIRALTLKPTYR
jgi:SNF2 family DNA or RNA helicase